MTSTSTSFVLTHRRLTPDEAVQIHRELKHTPNILGYSVRELTSMRNVIVAEREGLFAGAVWSVDLAFGWTEISAIVVLSDHRDHGIGRALFDAAWDQAADRRRSVYMLSRNSAVMDWMREKGMTIDGRLWSAPLAVHLHAPLYMSSWYRHAEYYRKRKEIRKCPSLVQGIFRR